MVAWTHTQVFPRRASRSVQPFFHSSRLDGHTVRSRYKKDILYRHPMSITCCMQCRRIIQVKTRDVGTRPNVTRPFLCYWRHLGNTTESSDNSRSEIWYPHQISWISAVSTLWLAHYCKTIPKMTNTRVHGAMVLHYFFSLPPQNLAWCE